MPYPEDMIGPMRAELVDAGFEELRTAADVDAFVARPGASLIVINSMCGCAAGSARPGIRLALEHEARPEHLGTAFAGNDLEAVAQIRTLVPDVPPSSPSAALFRDGKLVGFVPRHVFEGGNPDNVRDHLIEKFEALVAKGA